jgi:delta 1-pyrroline-5-carboxylate dehydrogenase
MIRRMITKLLNSQRLQENFFGPILHLSHERPAFETVSRKINQKRLSPHAWFKAHSP